MSHRGSPLCHRLSEYYEFLNMIGTSDRRCWLAEASKFLLLLLLHVVHIFRRVVMAR